MKAKYKIGDLVKCIGTSDIMTAKGIEPIPYGFINKKGVIKNIDYDVDDDAEYYVSFKELDDAITLYEGEIELVQFFSKEEFEI